MPMVSEVLSTYRPTFLLNDLRNKLPFDIAFVGDFVADHFRTPYEIMVIASDPILRHVQVYLEVIEINEPVVIFA